MFYMKRIDNYIRALAQLEAAVAIYKKAQDNSLYRDGLIQRFEFTVELAWKSAKEYLLEDQGAIVQYATPRAVLKDAYAAGMIAQPDIWNDILTARNSTSHIYSEDTAITIAAQICNDFLPVMQALRAFNKS